jgi:hypothetical protein
MNDRQRLEAIVAIVCKYLPPDGISREEAMNQIIGLVDPLPEKEWVNLTDDEKHHIKKQTTLEDYDGEYHDVYEVMKMTEEKLKERNT